MLWTCCGVCHVRCCSISGLNLAIINTVFMYSVHLTVNTDWSLSWRRVFIPCEVGTGILYLCNLDERPSSKGYSRIIVSVSLDVCCECSTLLLHHCCCLVQKLQDALGGLDTGGVIARYLTTLFKWQKFYIDTTREGILVFECSELVVAYFSIVCLSVLLSCPACRTALNISRQLIF